MDLYKYLLTDRQWRREHRISHARLMLKVAKSREEREFWRDVIEANIGDQNG